MAQEEIEVRPAWRRDDPRIEADAIEFWTRLALLPPGVDPRDRAKELLAAAYLDDRLIAVSTATLEHNETLRARFALLRGATDPAFRRLGAQYALGPPSRDALVAWALAHPEEKLAGALGYVERGEWGDFEKMPVWPGFELAVVGYTADGTQVRAYWFDHFRYD